MDGDAQKRFVWEVLAWLNVELSDVEKETIYCPARPLAPFIMCQIVVYYKRLVRSSEVRKNNKSRAKERRGLDNEEQDEWRDGSGTRDASEMTDRSEKTDRSELSDGAGSRDGSEASGQEVEQEEDYGRGGREDKQHLSDRRTGVHVRNSRI